MAAPTDIDLADAWSETLRRHARISCALERALQVEHGLGVSEFEVLEWLAVHGKDDCRMQELSEGFELRSADDGGTELTIRLSIATPEEAPAPEPATSTVSPSSLDCRPVF